MTAIDKHARPCPFCGHPDIDYATQPNNPEQPAWRQCGECGASGPRVTNDDADAGLPKATEAWNGRLTDVGSRVTGIRLRTVPAHEYGQHIVVLADVDGVEVEVIRSWGALPDITIDHTCTEAGIAAARRKPSPKEAG